ncbi:mucin-2 [Plodia interpunctella]|uniref:mucin-2 n=1 Tax=Plodia interpunctella TaxID=58824 RepID=UPI0023677BA5|nr:mucin-2 [Plodia interpunctella]
MDRRAAGALLALAACIASSAAAPTTNNQTALDVYDAVSEGCYYNFQHYGEGDRIMTNEPCLNCTCHNRMLMCYLRVCPFTKPIGQDCTVEKRADQCCPIVTCPDVPVDLLTSTSTSSPAEYGATGLGKLDKYGCSISGKYFPEGSKVPPTPNKPCEHCYCIRNMTTCVMQECTLHVDGCTPIYHKDVCCPVRYSCDHPEDEMPLLDDMSTTVRPTPGFLLTTTTTLSPVTQMTQDCVHNDQIFPDGTSIKTEKACEHCYCMKGDIVCVVQECGTPMENEGKNCTSQPPREGQCCPDTYICEGDEVPTEMSLDFTTETSLETMTTLVPPRRVIDEGSGYRKEEEEPIATILPSVEPEVEGSGEDFATLQPSEDKEMQTPSLIDERLSSTEDLVDTDTTSRSIVEIEKTTIEPDSALNTVPSDVTESAHISEPKLTTVFEQTETNQETEQTHIDINYTTASSKEEIPLQTTESAFRKEEESHIPIDITTEKAPQEYTTASIEPTKTTISEKQEAFTTMTETKATIPPETITEIPTSTTSDISVKESSTLFDHTLKETFSTVVQSETETTTLNAQENEIEDITTTQGPGRIPGEGDCLQNGVTYRNESIVPSNNNCLTDCKCISSIIKCDSIMCSPPPEYMSNCVTTYESSEACCPTYICDGSKETLPPQPHSQMSETTSSTPTPAVDCQGGQCDIHRIDKTPTPSDSCNNRDCTNKPSDTPESTNCGTEGCGAVQTPIQNVQPECSSQDCGAVVQPHEVPPVPSDTCSDSECQQHPILETERNDNIQPCDGNNCKTSENVQPCQNEEECNTIKIPEVETPCIGESCKNIPPVCNGKDCQILPDTVIPVCHGENCGSRDNQLPECLGEECKKTNITDVTGKLPVECSGDNCLSEPDKTEISTESSTQERITPSSTITESLQTEPTLIPLHEVSQTSDVIQEVTTDKPEETQTTSQFISEKPLSDSEESLEKTIKPTTDVPEIQTTAYVQIKETSPTSDLESQTESKQDEIITTPTRRHESEEASMTTKFTDMVTKLPEIAETTEIIAQTETFTEETTLPEKQFTRGESYTTEKSTEEVSGNHDFTETSTLSSNSKSETEITGAAEFETSAQPNTEQPGTPESDSTSQDQQYTKEPDLGKGEETTESHNLPSEETVSEEKNPTTEIPTKDGEKTSQTTVETPEFDKHSSPATVSIKTEATSLASSTLEPIVDVMTESQDKKTQLYDLQTQEPTIQTTSVPQSHDDKEKLSKGDTTITASSDIGLATTEPIISLDSDKMDTKPLIDKEKLPDIPTEEISTEPTEIDTEEPSLGTKQDEVTPQVFIEPESPDYIPVHPTVGDKSELDLIDRNTTPQSDSDMMVSTEQEHHSQTTEPSVPELEGDKPTEAPVEISPTETRKYNQGTTHATELDELTTTYPKVEKITESPESSTSKSPLEEELDVTTPSESFSNDKQEIIPTEVPESHVKETESGVEITAIPEIITEKLESVQTEEPQSVLQPNPTESQPSTISVELEKEPVEHDLETSTKEAPASTSEPKYEYSETTPDMIELVEHHEMMDVSTISSSISDLGTTLSPEAEKFDENLTTEKLLTPQVETEISTNRPLPSQHTEDETLPKQPEVSTDHETITEQPLEKKPSDEIATNLPDMEQNIPEDTTHSETSSEVVEKDISTKQPEIEPDFEHQTLPIEVTQTNKPEIIISDDGQRRTEGPAEDVTESKIELDMGSATEEPDISKIEIKPDKEYTTEKPEIEQEPIFEPESTTVGSGIPNTDRTIETKEPEATFTGNEVIPAHENVIPTVIPEIQQEVTSEKEKVTGEPEIVKTEQDIKPDQELITESPIISETIKESEVESSTEQEILPEPDVITKTTITPITENELINVQEFVTKETEFEGPNVESSTKLSDLPVSEDEVQTQSSTKEPETTEPEQNTILEKSSTEYPVISEVEKETKTPEIIQKIKPDDEFAEKDFTTEITETDADKATSVKEPEPSDVENEVSVEITTVLPEKEHRSSTEAPITEQPISNIDQESITETTIQTVTSSDTEVSEEPVVITEGPSKITEKSETSQEPTTNVPYVTEIFKESEKETSTEKAQETTTILLDLHSETTKTAIPEDQTESITKEPEISEVSITEHRTETYSPQTTDRPEISSIHYDVSTTETLAVENEAPVTEHDIVIKHEIITKETEKPEEGTVSSTTKQAVNEYETTERVTISPVLEESTKLYEKEKITPEHEVEKLTSISELFSTPSSTEKEKLPDETTPEIQGGSKYEDITKYTTPEYTSKDETTVPLSETEKPSILEEETTKPETEKPIEISKDTTAPEEEFLTVTSKATTSRVEIETSTHSEDLDKITKPHEIPEETSSVATADIPKPGFNEVHGTDEAPASEDESHFAPSATGGYGQEPDYEDENQPFGPGTCRYGGKVYVSAQQIPRDDPCDFCFCFRSDIICLQQSCPPPIHGCHEEPIQGFCCPRYECPVSMANTLNVTTTTTTTTTTLPPHFLPHAYQGAVQRRGCQIKGHTYKVGEVVRASSGPCLHCTCGGDGQMKCDPKACTPEPMLRQMIAAAVSAKRRR